MSGDDLVEEAIALRGRQVVMVRPRDSEALLDEAAFEHEEFLPYWAELWPSTVALARSVAGRALRGARVVELGCGLGLPSVVAALAGGRVLATDWAPEALAFVERNAAANGVTVETARVAWQRPEALVAQAPFGLVLASDVLYERRNVAPLLALLPRLVAPGGTVLLADPGRAPAQAFLDGLEGTWEVVSTPDRERPRVTVHRLTLAVPP